MINSRDKGASGEREWAATLQQLTGKPTRRGCQFAGGQDSPDVVGGIEGTHCEVKRVERLNLYDAMEQALRDAGSNTPYVAHRRDNKDWLITIRAADMLIFACLVACNGGNNETNKISSL